MRETIFVNLSNHPSEKWGPSQKKEAEKYGKIVDYAFPMVDATASEEEIEKMADRIKEDIVCMHPAAVLCQGEYTLCSAIIRRLLDEGISVLAGCSERMVVEIGDKKTSIYRFARFRKYR